MPAHIWELWYPEAASQGLYFAKGRLDASDVLLVHAPPPSLSASVFTDAGALVARADRLQRTAETPMAQLRIEDRSISREDIWPVEDDTGRPVMLPGGEVGLLVSWWNAEDHSEWRWRIELYNHR